MFACSDFTELIFVGIWPTKLILIFSYCLVIVGLSCIWHTHTWFLDIAIYLFFPLNTALLKYMYFIIKCSRLLCEILFEMQLWWGIMQCLRCFSCSSWNLEVDVLLSKTNIFGLWCYICILYLLYWPWSFYFKINTNLLICNLSKLRGKGTQKLYWSEVKDFHKLNIFAKVWLRIGRKNQGLIKFYTFCNLLKESFHFE